MWRHGAHRPRRSGGATGKWRDRPSAALLLPSDVQTPDIDAHVFLCRHARLQQPLSEECRRAVLPDRAVHDALLHRPLRRDHPASGGVREGRAVLRPRRRRVPARRRPGETLGHALYARRPIRPHDECIYSAERHLHEAGAGCRRQRLGASDALQQRQRLRPVGANRPRHRPSAERHRAGPAREPPVRLVAGRLQSPRLPHWLDQRRADQRHVPRHAPHQRERQGRRPDAHRRRLLRRHQTAALVAQCLHGRRRGPRIRSRQAPRDCFLDARSQRRRREEPQRTGDD